MGHVIEGGVSKINLEKILGKVAEAESLYHRLVVVVGGAGAGKTNVVRQLAARFVAPAINVNLELSRRLMDVAVGRRPLEVSRFLNQIVSADNSRYVILDNTEMLFHPDLQTDPLKLFQNLSRNRTVVASWNGSIDDGDLVYAAPGWPEYRRYPAGDVVTVCL